MHQEDFAGKYAGDSGYAGDGAYHLAGHCAASLYRNYVVIR